MISIDKVLGKARKSISKFCITECGAYCCRKGHLEVTEKQAVLITQDKIKKYENNNTLFKKKDGLFSLSLENSCPRLQNFKCSIHKNPKRPLKCMEFPIFKTGKSIRISSGCAAVKKQMLYPYEQQFLNLGYKLI